MRPTHHKGPAETGTSGEPQVRGRPVVWCHLGQSTVGPCLQPSTIRAILGERCRLSLARDSVDIGRRCPSYCHDDAYRGRPVVRPAAGVGWLRPGLPPQGLEMAGRPLLTPDSLPCRREGHTQIGWWTSP
ncbi:hypothetical protein NDU88_001397 [Pleurodeles waltl]|uniref:Uncharacterized protein n=1 Tax=Pleurodeles waltl TaxID=8319 RepID=A0AAV7P5D7_PLEWA|nr:hypothetical protein NDU88_001397 [Pleurodeles waltl]